MQLEILDPAIHVPLMSNALSRFAELKNHSSCRVHWNSLNSLTAIHIYPSLSVINLPLQGECLSATTGSKL